MLKTCSGVCSIKRQGCSLFIPMEKTAPKAQSALKCSVAMCSNLHSSGHSNPETECGVHCHNFNLHNRVGWRVCSANILKDGDGWEGLQAWAFLLGKSKKASVPCGISVDLLHLLCLPLAHSLPCHLGHFQLCTSGFGGVFGSHSGLVDGGCKEMVQGTS